MPSPNPKARHRRRHDDHQHARSLTWSCYRRQPFLNSNTTRQWLIEAIDRARERHDFHLWAFVVMPEHIHLLIYPQPTQPKVTTILTTIKQSVSQRARLELRNTNRTTPHSMIDTRPDGRQVTRFWQRGGGYDRNLWSPKHIWDTIDYIHNNPVRRDLCQRPTDWPWSSATAHANGTSTPLAIDRESIPPRP